ncbi:unnamed protein product [Adineta ricciae]|uniref:Uncharacterized protein n=1 Tax=Adineta ricciae TaxID=249248 RepID=A0A815U6N2_ADIRI|nr:unnamed protein product [Adineta ricciae]
MERLFNKKLFCESSHPEFNIVWVWRSFFEGYSMIAMAVVLCNSILGLATTAVYKYTDAIIKTFSTACATAVLLFLNWSLFNRPTNLNAVLGAVVIFISAYIYSSAGTIPQLNQIHASSNDPQNITDGVSMDLERNVKPKRQFRKSLLFFCRSLLIGAVILTCLSSISYFLLLRQ